MFSAAGLCMRPGTRRRASFNNAACLVLVIKDRLGQGLVHVVRTIIDMLDHAAPAYMQTHTERRQSTRKPRGTPHLVVVHLCSVAAATSKLMHCN